MLVVYGANEGLGLKAFAVDVGRSGPDLRDDKYFSQKRRLTWGRRPMSRSRPFRCRHICSFPPYTPATEKPNMPAFGAFPPCTKATARPIAPEMRNPEIGPGPTQKRNFLPQNIGRLGSGPDFPNMPAPSSSLHPMNGCPVFGLDGPCGPAHLLLPYPSLLSAKCAGMREPGPQSKTHFLRNLKRIDHSNSALDFPKFACSLLLPTPHELTDQMCLVWGLAGPHGHENRAHLLVKA